MKRILPLLFCMSLLLIATPVIGQQLSSASSVKQTTPSSATDALWISILPSLRESGINQQASYFDLQSDGRLFFAAGDPINLQVLRSGVVPKMLVRRAFKIVGKPSVLNASDTDAGEPILSDSEWVSVGLMKGGKVRAHGGWGYREEIEDFPADFQQLIRELRSLASKLPQTTNIKALLSASAANEKRVGSIGQDRFITLDQAALDKLPVLKEAILMSRRIVAVEDETQMSRLTELARQMNPQSKYWGLFKLGEQGYYEIASHYLQ